MPGFWNWNWNWDWDGNRDRGKWEAASEGRAAHFPLAG
jgi:hypothetical protein